MTEFKYGQIGTVFLTISKPTVGANCKCSKNELKMTEACHGTGTEHPRHLTMVT
jgi:hypothetical protein